jgi:hypothetical protein
VGGRGGTCGGPTSGRRLYDLIWTFRPRWTKFPG